MHCSLSRSVGYEVNNNFQFVILYSGVQPNVTTYNHQVLHEFSQEYEVVRLYINLLILNYLTAIKYYKNKYEYIFLLNT